MGCCADKISVQFEEHLLTANDPDTVLKENENKLIAEQPSKSSCATTKLTEDTNQAMRLQVEQLPEFKENNVWILDKNRQRESSKSAKPNIKAYSYDKKTMAQKRVTLSDKHNFLWFTSIIQGSLHSAERQSEITRISLDSVLNLLPVPFRDKIWEITNVEQDTFIVNEEYEEFVDALLIATGQYQISANQLDDDYEFRNMSNVFKQVVNIEKLFSVKRNVSNALSKTTVTLSNDGATKLILLVRNLDVDTEIPPNDISIPILTGFTKKAITHSVKYCTRIWWKIITDIWWDEDNRYHIALPYKLNEYKMKRRGSRRRSKVSQEVRSSLIRTSMKDLFPDLYEEEENSDDEEEDEPRSYSNKYLKV